VELREKEWDLAARVRERALAHAREQVSLSMAKCRSCGNWRVKEAGTVGSPGEVMKIRGLTCSRGVSLEGRLATQTGVDAPLVVVGGESIQLAMEVEAIPEEDLVEILAPKGTDQPLDERMRARHEGDALDFLDVENSQIRSPPMKPE
jgi:hypothetical protein